MSTNITQANEFLVKAKKAVEVGHLEQGKAWTYLAEVAMQAHMADKVGAVGKAIDRLADVVNKGQSWR